MNEITEGEKEFCWDFLLAFVTELGFIPKKPKKFRQIFEASWKNARDLYTKGETVKIKIDWEEAQR